MHVDSASSGQALSRRAILRIVALSAGAVALGACGPATAPAASTAPPAPKPTAPQAPTPTLAIAAQPTPAAASQPTLAAAPQATVTTTAARAGGTLRVGILTEPPNMDGFIQLSI